jgi:hypothetical protein
MDSKLNAFFSFKKMSFPGPAFFPADFFPADFLSPRSRRFTQINFWPTPCVFEYLRALAKASLNTSAGYFFPPLAPGASCWQARIPL